MFFNQQPRLFESTLISSWFLLIRFDSDHHICQTHLSKQPRGGLQGLLGVAEEGVGLTQNLTHSSFQFFPLCFLLLMVSLIFSTTAVPFFSCPLSLLLLLCNHSHTPPSLDDPSWSESFYVFIHPSAKTFNQSICLAVTIKRNDLCKCVRIDLCESVRAFVCVYHISIAL